MLPDKVPAEETLHAPEELKERAHVCSFEKYTELYNKSVDSPEGIINNNCKHQRIVSSLRSYAYNTNVAWLC